jgi:hypothetical protein
MLAHFCFFRIWAVGAFNFFETFDFEVAIFDKKLPKNSTQGKICNW